MTTEKPQCSGSEPADSQPTEPAQNGPGSPSSGGCNSCDLAEIEQLSCTAKKFARQADVMNEVTADLDTYKGQFDAARKKYSDARDAASADLEAVRKVLDGLAEQLRCRLTDTQRSCLEASCEAVFTDIDECSDPPGCHSPCDESDASSQETSNDILELAAEIQRRRGNLTQSAAYFTVLIAEPDTIAQQVLAITSEATKLKGDVDAGGNSSNALSWYARWLILETSAKMSRLGRGFDSVNAYVDCLCGVLRCLVSGWTVLALLEGRKAELDCYEVAKQALCEKKKKDTLQAILAAYEECCKTAPDPEPPSDNVEAGTAKS